jgi:hypothetical protein
MAQKEELMILKIQGIRMKPTPRSITTITVLMTITVHHMIPDPQ